MKNSYTGLYGNGEREIGGERERERDYKRLTIMPEASRPHCDLFWLNVTYINTSLPNSIPIYVTLLFSFPFFLPPIHNLPPISITWPPHESCKICRNCIFLQNPLNHKFSLSLSLTQILFPLDTRLSYDYSRHGRTSSQLLACWDH